MVGPSADDAADVDYLFGQVSVQTASVDFSGTCGNMASAVGLYAVEEGYTAGSADPGHVRIRDVGTGQILACDILDGTADEFANERAARHRHRGRAGPGRHAGRDDRIGAAHR